MIRLILADDQTLLRESLKDIIEKDEEIKVVACASDGSEAVMLCDSFLPDIVLMDIKMPGCDGVEGTALIKSTHTNIKVLILTTFDDEENIKEALKNGADGYVLKDIKPSDLIQAIKSIVAGFSIMSNKTYDTIFKQMSGAASKTDLPDFDLREREQEVLQLIAEGKSNKVIANELCLAEGSVKNIVTSLLEKLNASNRYQLLSLAYKYNLIK